MLRTADEETSDDEPLLPATSTGSKGVSFSLPDRKPSLARVRGLHHAGRRTTSLPWQRTLWRASLTWQWAGVRRERPVLWEWSNVLT